MKRFLTFILAIVLLFTALLAFSSCGSKKYEICSRDVDKYTFYYYTDVDPQSLEAGDIKSCKIFVYDDDDGEEDGDMPASILPAFISVYTSYDSYCVEIRGTSGDLYFTYSHVSKKWKYYDIDMT